MQHDAPPDTVSDEPPPNEGVPSAEEPSFGELDASFRIIVPTTQRDRTFAIALCIVAAFYVGVIGYEVARPHASAPSEEEQRKGQLDGPPSIEVQIVELPDEHAKTKQSRDGNAPQDATQPEPQQPQPAEQQQKPEPPKEQAKQEPPPKEDPPPKEEPPKEQPEITEQADAAEPEQSKPEEEKEGQSEIPTLDAENFDLSLEPYAQAMAKQIEQDKRERAQSRQAALAGGRARQTGQGATGQKSAYARSVFSALSKSRPFVVNRRPDVLVRFEISPTGQLVYVRILQSSGDASLDNSVVTAVKKTRFPVPPPGTPDTDRIYTINYTYD